MPSSDVLVDGVSVGPVTSYDFTNVMEDHAISATFAPAEFTVTATRIRWPRHRDASDPAGRSTTEQQP